jgi:hypothetical protein
MISMPDPSSEPDDLSGKGAEAVDALALAAKLREVAPDLAEHLQAWIDETAQEGSEAGSIESFLSRLLREAKVALGEEQAALAAVLATPHDEAVLIVNNLGVIEGICKHSVEILGCKNLIGRPIDALLEAQAAGIEVSSDEMARAARGERVLSRRTQKREDGSTFESRHIVVALFGSLGELHGFARRIDDISERRLHEVQIQVLTDSVALLMRRRQA